MTKKSAVKLSMTLIASTMVLLLIVKGGPVALMVALVGLTLVLL